MSPLLCQTLRRAELRHHNTSRRGRPALTEIRHIKRSCDPFFLPFSFPFAFSRPTTFSLLPLPHRHHFTSYLTPADRAKSARSRSNPLSPRFFVNSDSPAAPPSRSTAPSPQSRNMNTLPQPGNTPNVAPPSTTRLVLHNIDLPSRPSSYAQWAISSKPPVYKVRTFFDLLRAVDLIRPSRDWRLLAADGVHSIRDAVRLYAYG